MAITRDAVAALERSSAILALVELHADLEAPCPPAELFGWVDDLARYPAWLTIVTRAEPYATEPPAWSVA